MSCSLTGDLPFVFGSAIRAASLARNLRIDLITILILIANPLKAADADQSPSGLLPEWSLPSYKPSRRQNAIPRAIS
jgi:hypothetical protein